MIIKLIVKTLCYNFYAMDPGPDVVNTAFFYLDTDKINKAMELADTDEFKLFNSAAHIQTIMDCVSNGETVLDELDERDAEDAIWNFPEDYKLICAGDGMLCAHYDYTVEQCIATYAG